MPDAAIEEGISGKGAADGASPQGGRADERSRGRSPVAGPDWRLPGPRRRAMRLAVVALPPPSSAPETGEPADGQWVVEMRMAETYDASALENGIDAAVPLA